MFDTSVHVQELSLKFVPSLFTNNTKFLDLFEDCFN